MSARGPPPLSSFLPTVTGSGHPRCHEVIETPGLLGTVTAMVSTAPGAHRLRTVLAWVDRRPALAVLVVLVPLFLATANFGPGHHIDPLTNVMTAWKLGTSASVVLPEYESLTGPGFYNVANQLVETDHGPISKYPPGSALLAAPFYTVVRDRLEMNAVYKEDTSDGPLERSLALELPRVWPGSVAAALATAGAMALLTQAMVPVVGPRWAVATGLITGLGTSFWSVAADALWQHGPAALGIAVGLLGASRGRYLLASSGFAIAVITRPQTAIIAAVIGIWAAARDRSLVTLVKAGLLASAAAGVYVAFNLWAFGDLIVRDAGGYWVEGTVNRGWFTTIQQFVGALVSIPHGAFVWSPFLLVGLLAVPRVWRDSPWWAKAGALAGIVYLLVQVRGNGFVGGQSFRWYRYQLEPIIAAAPLLFLALQNLWATHRNWRRLVVLVVGSSIVVHAFAALH